MANIFRAPASAPIFPRAFVGTDVIPNILLGLAALLTPLKQPFNQHEWPVPERARAGAPQDHQCAGYTTRNIPPPPPFYQTDQPNPPPPPRITPQDWQCSGVTTQGIPRTPFNQSEWPVPLAARIAPQDFQKSSTQTFGIPPPPPFFQNEWPLPLWAKITPQAWENGGYTTRGIPPPPPFRPAEWTYQIPVYTPPRPTYIDSDFFVAPPFRTAQSAPFVPSEWPTPIPVRPAVIETTYFVPPQFRPAPATAPLTTTEWPVPLRPHPARHDSTLGSSLALLTSTPLRAVSRLPLQTHILASVPCRSIYDDQVPAPHALLLAIVQSASQQVYAREEQEQIHRAGGTVFGAVPPNAPSPIIGTEFTVGGHQQVIADSHSRGSVFGDPSISTGARPIFGLSAVVSESRSLTDPASSWVKGPNTTVLFPAANLFTPAWICIPESLEPFEAVSSNVPIVWGPQPPSAFQKLSQFVSAAPQQIDLPQGFADVYTLPQPTSGGQSVETEFYADQDWPEARPSWVETTYTPLFARLPAPLFRPQISGSQLDSERLQPNPSAVSGPLPPSAISVPLGPLPQAAPQQSDQGYGLLASYGWSSFPPASIAPDIPRAYYFIPQAAPQQLDYLQGNESSVSASQPPTASRAPINRTAWTDPEQKTIASQQAYGTTFGNRKPPNYFINVKMVPGEDNPEQPSGSAGHGSLWTITPPAALPFVVTFEFQIGTHQRAVADQHSRGWVVPASPPSAIGQLLRPVIFAAPQQSDEGKAQIYRKPPPSAQKPPLEPFVYGQRIEDLEAAYLMTTEPLVAPPQPVPLGPIDFAFSVERLDQPQPDTYSQQIVPVVVPPSGSAVSTEFVFGTHQRDILDQHSRGWVTPAIPPSAGTALLNLEFYAGQQSTEQPFAEIYAIAPGVAPQEFLGIYYADSQEYPDRGYGQLSPVGQFQVPGRQRPPNRPTFFVPAEIPDQGNVGPASLSKPLLPLPTPALPTIIYASREARDLGDVAGYTGRVYGPQPPSGSGPPITVSLFVAPDHRNQADSVSGGSVRGVWTRNVPTLLTAPHMLPLGFGLIRLGGIQMN